MKKDSLNDIYARSLSLNEQSAPEFFECAGDLLATPEVSGLEKYVQHDYINRLRHIKSVSYMTFCLCKKYSLDYKTAARAGVMHDLFYYDWHENDWSHRPHGYRHPGFAVRNARELCGGIDKKTENMIKRHMWPLTVIPPRYKEGMLLCVADKYCAARELAECKKAKKSKNK